MKYSVTASIVLYNSDAEEVSQAVHSFLQDTDAQAHIILIDHSPTNLLQAAFHGVEKLSYYHHPENKGYGAGHNIALRQVIDESPFHLVMNPDVSFQPGTIPTLIDYFQSHESVGQIMPKIVSPSGAVQHLAKLIPTPMDLIFKRFLPTSWIAKRHALFTLQFTGYNQVMAVPYLSGCFMAFRMKSLQEIGLFDERFFMYPEDIDITRRMYEQYLPIYLPEATVVHRHEAASYKNFKLLWIHIRNMILYFNKWGWIWDKKRKQINQQVLKDLNYFHHESHS